MIRHIIAIVAVAALASTAWAQQPTQQPQAGEQQVRQFLNELSQDLARDPEAYSNKLSFPVTITVVTNEGEVLTGTFEEHEYRLLGYLPADQIRFHAAQQAVLGRGMAGQRAAADVESDDEMDQDEMFVQEELALMPRDRVIEQSTVTPMRTQVTFLNENVAFARMTLVVGEPAAVGAMQQERGQDERAAADTDDEMAEDSDDLVLEERAVRPTASQAHIDIGAMLVRENGEWRVKSIITGETRLGAQQ